MRTINDIRRLYGAGELTDEIADDEAQQRRDTQRQLVGWLYPSILDSEIEDIQRMKRGEGPAALEQEATAYEPRDVLDMQAELVRLRGLREEFIQLSKMHAQLFTASVTFREVVRGIFESWESQADSRDAAREAMLSKYTAWVRALRGEAPEEKSPSQG